MSAQLFLGVDGGGTKCRARLVNSVGQTVGECEGGPANLGLDVGTIHASISDVVSNVLASAAGKSYSRHKIIAALGLAGANVPSLRSKIDFKKLAFASQVVIVSDAEIACLGAHGGNDGGILILGTGSQGYVSLDGTVQTIGGWGFALADQGSGAVIGHAAARYALLAYERVVPPSSFTDKVMARFGHSPLCMVEWAQTAKPSDWGQLAPIVFDAADTGDLGARSLVAQAVTEVEATLARMVEIGARRIALLGGLADRYKCRLGKECSTKVVDPVGDALDGAIMLARRSAERLTDTPQPTDE